MSWHRSTLGELSALGTPITDYRLPTTDTANRKPRSRGGEEPIRIQRATGHRAQGRATRACPIRPRHRTGSGVRAYSFGPTPAVAPQAAPVARTTNYEPLLQSATEMK